MTVKLTEAQVRALRSVGRFVCANDDWDALLTHPNITNLIIWNENSGRILITPAAIAAIAEHERTEVMTPAEQMREDVAVAMWHEEAARAAPNVARTRNAASWVDQSDKTRAVWLAYADAAIRALPLPAEAPLPGMMVKSLVWEDAGEGLLLADVIFAKACIVPAKKKGIFTLGIMAEYSDHQSIGDAKAAAQANYEARILAAIPSAPVSLADAARVLLVAIHKDANDPLMSAMGFGFEVFCASRGVSEAQRFDMGFTAALQSIAEKDE